PQFCFSCLYSFCFSSYFSNDTSNLLVFLGSQTLLSLSPYRVFRTVTQIISHPDFNPATLDNDIALVRLSSPVNFTTHVLPVCLAASGSTFYNGTDAWVTGWGNTAIGVPPPVPYNLREVDVPVVGNRQCNCDYGVGTITDNMMCAGSPAGGKGTCQVITVTFYLVYLYLCTSDPFGVYLLDTLLIDSLLEGRRRRSASEQAGRSLDPGGHCEFWNCLCRASFTRSLHSVVCGQAPMNSGLMGGGSVATAGVWPWIVSIQKNGSHVCGGTLVAVEHVLSNADCFSSSPKSAEWAVVLGRLKQNGSNPSEVTLKVTNITLSNLNTSNVAVLQMASLPTLSNLIQPICLGNGRTFSVGSTCWAAGWSARQGGVEQVLQEFQTSVVNCGPTAATDSICMTAFTLEQGDSGGPVMCQQDGSWFQAAVLTVQNTSTTTTTGRAGDTLVFTQVRSYNNFLKQILGTFLSPASTNSSTSPLNATVTTTPNTTMTTNVTTNGGAPAHYHFFFHLVFSLCLHFFL
uniref:transmembrane protease serine 9-like n=1 Tax=Monopterus albus TaxID=43700 RepID=UPI0009B362F0